MNEPKTMEELDEALSDILLRAPDPSDYWGSDKEVVVSHYSDHRGTGFEIKYGAMYGRPELNLPTLMKLVELFGTEKIDVNDYAIGGCETCDYGSDYGHTITVLNPTKCVELAAELARFGQWECQSTDRKK